MRNSHIPDGPRLVESALAFAHVRHEGQLRKGTTLPYFVHPAGVSAALARAYPTNFALAAAGACHDLIEDTSTTREELVERFGEQVASLVAAVSSPRGRDWSDTRRLALEQLRMSSDDAVRLKVADSLDNATATVLDIEAHGLSTLDRFGSKPARIFDWYGAVATLGRARLGEEPLVLALEACVVSLRDHLTTGAS